MSDTVTRLQLANGLTVHLKEIHTAPLISHWVWYRVGSRNELPGKTGVSHWVEHMQFKGTPQFPAGILDKAISRDGGYWNAFTFLDWTAFFETMPAEKVELGLHLESDRMANGIYAPEEVESERTVIISEREGSENEPLFRLSEAMQVAAFEKHPYRHEIVGEKADLHTLTREDLFQHYHSHYMPNNAVLAIAGDFDTSAMLALVEKYYGVLKPGSTPILAVPVEPPQTAEKQLEVSGPGDTTYMQVVYHAPAANTCDFYAITLLSSLLTGPAGLNMFGGGGTSNKTSRLYRALVEKELAIGIGGGLSATIDPHLYEISLTVHPQRAPQEALTALDEQISKLQQELVSADEVHRAAKQARALFAFGSENITNQAFWLGYSEMFASYDWFLTYLQQLEQVTPQDIQRVAQGYLQASQRVVGVYLPTREEVQGEQQ